MLRATLVCDLCGHTQEQMLPQEGPPKCESCGQPILTPFNTRKEVEDGRKKHPRADQAK